MSFMNTMRIIREKENGIMETIKYLGQEMYDLANKIFPLCKSITGAGVRETLRRLSEYLDQDGIKLELHEVPTGTIRAQSSGSDRLALAFPKSSFQY